MSVRLMLHFWWNPKVLVFWTVVQPPLLGVLKVQRLCFPRVMNMIHEFQMLIPLVVDLSFLEMVPRARPLHCPNSQSEMMLLVNSGSLCICSLTNRNRLH